MMEEKNELSHEEDEEIGGEDESGDEISDFFPCKYCDYQSTNIDELDEHIVTHDEAILEDDFDDEIEANQNVGNEPFHISTSPVKNDSSDDALSLEPPLKKIKQELPAFYDEFKGKPEKRVFVCPYCGYQSMKKQDMTKHVKVHNAPVEVPIYACAECPYTTRRKCDMPKHLLTHCKDGSVTMYKCDYCPYATKRKGDLPKHTICHKKPELDDLFRCNVCSYSSRRRGDLKKHQSSHECDLHIKDNYLYNCTECGYTSKRLNDLHKHVVLHCDKAVKGILKCKRCDYASQVSSHFAKHVLSQCRIMDMEVPIFPKDPETMQDYIVLEEDELHLYQIDKDGINSVGMMEKDNGVFKNTRTRKRVISDKDVDNFYIEDTEASKLLERVESRERGRKVLVLSGYENERGNNQAT